MRIMSTAAALLFLLAPASVAFAQTAPSQDPGTKAQDSMRQGQTAQTQPQQPKQKLHRKSARHRKPLHHRASMHRRGRPHTTAMHSKSTARRKAQPSRKARATTKQNRTNSTY
jgi:hypothetical protein